MDDSGSMRHRVRDRGFEVSTNVEKETKVKRLAVLLIVVLLLAAGVQVQDSECRYDGIFNPKDFFSWEVITMVPDAQGYVHVLLANPDKDHAVQRVETINVPVGGERMRLVAYRYMIEDQVYIFVYKESTGRYEQVVPPKLDV